MLLEVVERVRAQLARIPDVDLQHDEKLAPASAHALHALEREIKQRLPISLHQVLTQEAGGLAFGWSTSNEPFGPDCRYGRIHLLAPDEIIEVARELREYAAEVRQEPQLAAKAGFAAMVEDWPFWIPVCRFASADCFCLDVRRGRQDYPVVFLEHDVMDGGPTVHGLQIAPNLDELLRRWSKLAFVDLHDWTEGVAEDGINVEAVVFQHLREQLRG